MRLSPLNALLASMLLLAAPAAVRAQEEGIPPAAETRVTLAPPTVREVVAEGRAAIGAGGVLGARKAAEAQALRNAVEKALGVYVSARTLTQNYVMVRDQVITNATGYATLKEIVKEEVGTQEVRVTVRALVSLRPLAEQLKALKLTRAFRVRVTTERGTAEGRPTAEAAAALERALAEAGFVVVTAEQEADLIVLIAPRFNTVASRQVPAGDTWMTMHSVRGDVTVRATRVGTGEIVAALSGADTALHIDLTTARATAASGAMDALAPRLAESLMVLPAALSQPVTLAVSGLTRAAQVGRLEDALNDVPGVRAVTRRSYANGTATWELDLFSDSLPSLSRNLEEFPALRPFRLSVASETRARILATATPAAPKGRPVARKTP
jgi:hypothetical protein